MIDNGNVYIDSYDSELLENLRDRVMSVLSKDGMLEEYIHTSAETLIKESHSYTEIQFGYKILNFIEIEIKNDMIYLTKDLSFNCSRIIASQLKGIEGLTIFTATLGGKYDQWFKDLFNSNKPLEGYIADLIGSVTVECAADVLEKRITNFFVENNLGCSNRYSPGYCDWNVSEQKKLFSLLPENFCGIELTESSLMVPIKSVSGIIGFGKNVVKKDYACKICTQENCYMNKLKAI